MRLLVVNRLCCGLGEGMVFPEERKAKELSVGEEWYGDRGEFNMECAVLRGGVIYW